MKYNSLKYYLLLLLLLVAGTATAFESDFEYTYCLKKGDITSFIANKEFPMHSVMKFPQALYVAHYLSTNGIPLSQEVVVEKDKLMHDTWSPMLKIEKNTFTYSELLALSLQQSDNNACDILFKHCGKPKTVEKYIKSLGIKRISIKKTEQQMHDNPECMNKNTCDDSAMVQLLEWFYDHHNDNEYLKYIWDLMLNCDTGKERILAALPPEASFLHKTGTGPKNKNSQYDANDVGIILMPDGTHISIAIFTRNATSESDVAKVALGAFEAFKIGGFKLFEESDK